MFNPRPLYVSLAFSAAVLGVGWYLGAWGEDPDPYIPRFFDRIEPGMTVSELKALGGLPHDPSAPGGPPAFEFQVKADPNVRGVQTIHGDPFICETRFVKGQLAYFKVDTSDNYAGAKVDHGDLLELVPALVEAKTLRRTVPVEVLVDALGDGIRVARIVDAKVGKIDVFRWDVEVEERRVARLEAHVANGKIIEHHLDGK